jgi:hypothetical protein
MASRALEVACVDVSGGSKLDAPEDVLLDVLDFGARQAWQAHLLVWRCRWAW